MKSLSDIVYEDVPLTYADIMVWFSNKECSEHLEVIVSLTSYIEKNMG